MTRDELLNAMAHELRLNGSSNAATELLREYDAQGAGGGAVAPFGYWSNIHHQFSCKKNSTYFQLLLDTLRKGGNVEWPDGATLLYTHPPSLASDFTMEDATDRFLADVRAELIRARTKFPGDRIMTIALAEEFGELCKAVLDEPSAACWKEAVQCAVMAGRVVIDGDGSVNDWRAEKGLDALTDAALNATFPKGRPAAEVGEVEHLTNELTRVSMLETVNRTECHRQQNLLIRARDTLRTWLTPEADDGSPRAKQSWKVIEDIYALYDSSVKEVPLPVQLANVVREAFREDDDPQPSDDMEPWRTAWYEVAYALGIPAMPKSPELVHRDDVMPKLRALLSPTPAAPAAVVGDAGCMDCAYNPGLCDIHNAASVPLQAGEELP